MIDISGWEPAGDEYLGTKPKQWVRDSENRLWLWKESTFNVDRLGQPYRKGDDWSEVIAARLGAALGVPVATVQLAVRVDRCGVVSRRVFDDDADSLVHGNELLADAGVVPRHAHDRAGYTVAAVAQALSTVGPPLATDELPSAFDWFAGYLVLDALIGNTDRHQDNWATIRSRAGRRLAPSFDHASSLGFLLSDEERVKRLSTADRQHAVDAYARKARTKFDGRPSPLEAAVEGLQLATAPARVHWKAVVSRAPDLADALAGIPGERMSPAAKQFAKALYRANLTSLSYLLRRMES